MNIENEPIQAAESPDYLEALWRRLEMTEPGKPLEERTSEKARREVEQISDPLFIAKAKAIIGRKLAGKPEDADLFTVRILLAALLKGPLAAEARGFLIELFQRPEISPKLQIELVEAATEAKTAGITEYARPLLEKPRQGHIAAKYFTAVPDPAAVDALGRYFLAGAMAGKGSDMFTLQAMAANCSPGLLKYMVPVLERERMGKNENEIAPRMSALHIIGLIGDVSTVPLVMRELQYYSDRSTLSAGLSALANLPDGQACGVVLEVVSGYIKKYYESKKAGPSPLDTTLTFAWTYFQKTGRDHTPEVLTLLRRLARPEVWQKIGEEDKEFFETRYRDLVSFPDSETPRQQWAAIYQDEARSMPERVSAFNQLLDSFKEHTRESVVKKYVTPQAEIMWPVREGSVGEGGVQFVDWRLTGPDGSKHQIQIRRSQKRNAVGMIIKNARF